MNKWVIYVVTFLTYSSIHSIRTCWSALKPFLSQKPYSLDDQYLGILDMTVLFSLAICLNLFGGLAEKYPCRNLLFGTMAILIFNLQLLGILLLNDVGRVQVYLILYGFTVGVFSCMGWPVCLYVLSQYFKKDETLPLSMWNGVSQFGDFLALVLTFIILQNLQINGGYSLIITGIIIFVILMVDIKFLKPKSQEGEGKIESQRPHLKVNVPSKTPEIISQVQNLFTVEKQTTSTKINFLNVWCLPGVALPILSYSLVKSINAIIISWQVLELYQSNFNDSARIMTICWSVSILGGGFLGSKINGQLCYRKFIISLVICGFLFILVQKYCLQGKEYSMFFLMIVTGLIVGGPYNQMSTAVPVMLGNKEEIRSKPGAKTCIISLMEGFGQFMCGVTVLVVPQIGISQLYWIASFLCGLGAFLLMIELLRERIQAKEKIKRQVELVEEN